ncbi:unnamed protein product, partial [marine sediment metagenome]
SLSKVNNLKIGIILPFFLKLLKLFYNHNTGVLRLYRTNKILR